MMDKTIDRVKYGDVMVVSGDLSEGVVKTKLASRITDMVWLAIGKLMNEKGCWEKVLDQNVDVAEFAMQLSIDCGYSLFPEPCEEDEDE